MLIFSLICIGAFSASLHVKSSMLKRIYLYKPQGINYLKKQPLRLPLVLEITAGVRNQRWRWLVIYYPYTVLVYIYTLYERGGSSHIYVHRYKESIGSVKYR